MGLATVYPIPFSHAQLFGLFKGKGHATPAITPNDEFYVTSYDLTPTVALDRWTLTIGGMVDNPLVLSFEDLMKRLQTTMISTLECIGNTVGGYSIGTARWEGVKINQILEESGFNPKAFDLVLRGADGYSDNFPLSRALEEDVLLATKMNGVPLPPDHGFPARVIVPGIYGMKNVKWLTGLELVNYDYKGHWQQQSWSDTALVKLSSRIDLPGDRERVTTSKYKMKGIAFNGRLRIHKVEVSTDAGNTWQEAKLESKLSPQTWTPWSYEWTIPQSGEFTIMARATNEQGLQQTLNTKPSSTERLEIHAITVEAKI
ncbi:molybdopterin-dependent oxidoreductase [Candidatus Nitronereus thalassa]|uniref:Molybdopterin-dependent oxidoreductase n=1 Tax=Candidatus Nitronereus thalassa TaxID=3020898 RepID=A0ABU3K5G9_9BACT|nr:molybdopterin-dependent oxidoreductase [Candidatus Nitronereus thalassa]MDT7041621.1 molybdopterin-dependent oxidoreductase [Candidatus Nitronereus thalassa]